MLHPLWVREYFYTRSCPTQTSLDMPETKPLTDQTSEHELREQVAYLQFFLLKNQVID